MSKHVGSQAQLLVSAFALAHLRFQQVPLGFDLLAQALAFQQIGNAQACGAGFQWFGEVVHRTKCQTFGFRRGVVLAGDEHHRNFAECRVGLQALARLESVQPRHHHVQQDEVWL